MEERVRRVEAELERLAALVSGVEDRLAAIERTVATGAAELESRTPAEPVGLTRPAAEPAAEAPGFAEVPGLSAGAALAGRTILALGGGFLLRAVTDAALVPGLFGLVAGLAYAGSWAVLADRAARQQQERSALGHAVTATLLAFPLAAEATVRFELLSPLLGTLVLAVFGGMLLGLAARRALPAVSWIVVAATAAASLAISFGARQPEPGALLFAILAPALAVASVRNHWRVAPWLGIGAAALSLLIVDVGTLVGRAAIQPSTALMIQLLFVAAVLVSTEAMLRLAAGSRRPLVQWAQAAAAIALGYAVALVLAHTRLQAALLPLGLASLAVAALIYIRLLNGRVRPLPDDDARRLAAVLALILLAGGIGSLPLGWASVGWSIASVGLATAAWRVAVRAPVLHAAVLVALAAATGGLLSLAFRALAAPLPFMVDGSTLSLFALVSPVAAIAAAIACAWLPPSSEPAGAAWPEWSETVARLVPLSVALLGVSGLVFGGVLSWLGSNLGSHGTALDPGWVAAARTGVLALLAAGAAALSRTVRVRHAAWLVYPLFVAAGIKLVLEDFPNGRPATLFASLGFYGLALLVVPRLARR